MAGLLCLPTLGVGVVGQPAQLGERVINVTAAVGIHQRLIARQRGGNPDLLRAPVEIDADRVGREHHERPHAGVCVEQALGVRVAAGGGAERKQARPVAAVAADRQLRAHDDAEAVAQRVQPLDRRARDTSAGKHRRRCRACRSPVAATPSHRCARAIARNAHSSIRLPACRSDHRCRGSGRIAAIVRR